MVRENACFGKKKQKIVGVKATIAARVSETNGEYDSKIQNIDREIAS